MILCSSQMNPFLFSSFSTSSDDFPQDPQPDLISQMSGLLVFCLTLPKVAVDFVFIPVAAGMGNAPITPLSQKGQLSSSYWPTMMLVWSSRLESLRGVGSCA